MTFDFPILAFFSKFTSGGTKDSRNFENLPKKIFQSPNNTVPLHFFRIQPHEIQFLTGTDSSAFPAFLHETERVGHELRFGNVHFAPDLRRGGDFGKRAAERLDAERFIVSHRLQRTKDLIPRNVPLARRAAVVGGDVDVDQLFRREEIQSLRHAFFLNICVECVEHQTVIRVIHRPNETQPFLDRVDEVRLEPVHALQSHHDAEFFRILCRLAHTFGRPLPLILRHWNSRKAADPRMVRTNELSASEGGGTVQDPLILLNAAPTHCRITGGRTVVGIPASTRRHVKPQFRSGFSDDPALFNVRRKKRKLDPRIPDLPDLLKNGKERFVDRVAPQKSVDGINHAFFSKVSVSFRTANENLTQCFAPFVRHFPRQFSILPFPGKIFKGG